MRKDDVIGISTMTFTPTGEAFYLSSSSELARVSMAAAYNLQATGMYVQINLDLNFEKDGINNQNFRT